MLGISEQGDVIIWDEKLISIVNDESKEFNYG